MDIREQIIELEDGLEYAIVDTIVFSDRTFALAGKVLNEEQIDDLEIFEIISNDGFNSFEKIQDEELENKIKEIFKGNL